MAKRLSRRTFLKGAGVALALPWLDAMAPLNPARASAPASVRRRMLCVDYDLSLYTPYLFPEESGQKYKLTPYLEILKDFRNDFTVFSGLSHPGMEASGGHPCNLSFLTGAPGVGRPSFKNTISLDQLVAEKIGLQTRLPYICFGSISYSRSGVSVPSMHGPSQIFAKCFLQGTPEELQLQVRRLQQGQSIMDVVRGQARRLEQKVGRGDREKLDEYFDSVRDVEQRLTSAESWVHKPKPKVNVPPPKDVPGNTSATMRLYYDLMHLVFQTDSTRLSTATFVHWGVPPLGGVTYDHHNLSHHGKDPEKLRQLSIVEMDKFKALREFLRKLKDTKEEGQTLLDRTMVLVGSHMGSGHHTVDNLPILLAGGGFKHGQHLAFDRANNKPLCNLFVMMLRQFGLEVNSFGTSTGTIPGLETI
jgi:hypothetical protein